MIRSVLYICTMACFALVLCMSCNSNNIPKPVLKLTEDRMLIFKTEHDSICKSLATKKAEKAVDSFFLNLSMRYLLDTIMIPDKPIKPYVDTSIQLNNTTPVKPLWDSLKVRR